MRISLALDSKTLPDATYQRETYPYQDYSLPYRKKNIKNKSVLSFNTKDYKMSSVLDIFIRAFLFRPQILSIPAVKVDIKKGNISVDVDRDPFV